MISQVKCETGESKVGTPPNNLRPPREHPDRLQHFAPHLPENKTKHFTFWTLPGGTGPSLKLLQAMPRETIPNHLEAAQNNEFLGSQLTRGEFTR
jgi:hypothetical protein